MRAIGPIQVPGVNEAHEGLVHERSRLQRVSGALVPHVAARHAVQPLVHERRQAIQGSRISAPPGLQQTGDFRGFFGARHSPVS
jgi:hypothetical protein